MSTQWTAAPRFFVVALLMIVANLASLPARAQYTDPAPGWPYNGFVPQVLTTASANQVAVSCSNPAADVNVTTTTQGSQRVFPPYFATRGLDPQYGGALSTTVTSNPYTYTSSSPGSTLTYNYYLDPSGVLTESITLDYTYNGPYSDYSIFTETYHYVYSSVYSTKTGIQNFSYSETANGNGSDPDTGTVNYLCQYTETYTETGETTVNYSGVDGAPTIASTLAAGKAGVSYSDTLVTGGTPPYTVSATGLPPGLSANSDGTVSGTPAASDSGPYTAMVSVTDADGQTAGPDPVTITIDPPIVIVSSLTAGQVGLTYPSTQLVSGGTPPYQVSASGLPAGLTVSATGLLSGAVSASAAGSYSVVVSASDSLGETATLSIPLTISDAPPPPPFISQQTKQEFDFAASEWGLVGSGLAQLAEECGGIPQCVEFFEAAGLIADAVELPLDIIAADPVDPNYKSIAKPVFFKAVQVQPQSTYKDTAGPLNTLLNSNAKVLALTRALIIAHNRYDGAVAANDNVWAERQLLAAKLYSLRVSHLLKHQPELLFEIEAALKHDQVKSQQVSQAQVQAMASSSLPASVVAQLKADGVTSDEIATLQSGRSSLTATTGFSFPSGLVDRNFLTPIVTAANGAAEFAADRNNDGKVDCADVQIVVNALHTRTGQAKFDPRADVNGDGVVNNFDLWIIERNLPSDLRCKCPTLWRH
jgi:hypothetical protein